MRIFAMMTLLLSAAIALAADPPVPAVVNPPVDPAEEISQVPALPATPASVKGVLYARPFTLAQPYESEWRVERPQVAAGWLLVLEVEPAYVFPRQVAEPVLYVGKSTAERINIGYESGRVIVIAPSSLNEKGQVALDLHKALMWFGTPALPEQVDAAQVEAERRAAQAAGIAPLPKKVIDEAIAKGGAAVAAANRTELRALAADLIKLHAPQELELAEQLLADRDAR